MLTPEEKKAVERLRKDPNIKWKEGLTDEEILAEARFVETGGGVEVYDSEEAYRAAKKKEAAAKSIDEIEEV